MAIRYSIVDWRACVNALVSDADFVGGYTKMTQAEYNSITWRDARTKPTWAEIINVWTHPTNPGSGVNHGRHSPGDVKPSMMTEDHGNWLLLDPVAGRKLDKVTYAMLYYIVGDAYKDLYPGIIASEFGLPILADRVVIAASATRAMGSKGGAESQKLTAAQLPAHTHSLNTNILIAGSGLLLGGLTAILGSTGRLSPAATGSAGSADPTPVSVMQPYWAANMFVFRGELKFDNQGGTEYS